MIAKNPTLPHTLGGDRRVATLTGVQEPTVKEFAQMLWRRKTLLGGTILTVTVLAAIIVFQMVPRYTAVSKVMLDPRKNQVVEFMSVFSGLPSDMETLESEIEVIRSRGLADAVIKKLRLHNDPEFNPSLVQPGKWSKYLSLKTYIPDFLLDLLSPASPRPEASEEELRYIAHVQTIDTFLDKLEVWRSGNSRVINIYFTSEDPVTATEVANTIADLYLVAQLEAKFEATKRATEWLNDRLTKLREAVAGSERAVERFRVSSGLIEGKGVTLASQQVSELNTQIILARTKRAEAEARLKQVQNLLASASGVESVAEVLTSPLIQRLREQEAQVQRKAAELSQEFGEKHPRMINVHAEIRDLKAKIKGEVRKIVEGLRNEVNIARVRERSLIKSLHQLEQRVAQQNKNEVQLRALEREAKANRTLYETYLARFKESNEQQGIQQPDARIIARADMPVKPSYPKTFLFISIAMFASVFLGIGLIALVEHLDHGFRSMDQVEQMTGIPSLGLIPAVQSAGRGKQEPQDYILAKPASAYGESIRALHAGLLLSDVDHPPKVVLVTSALPSEGKTTLSLSLARMISRTSGKNVVLVDCDLRRPRVHTKFGLAAKPGLIEYLSGEATLKEVLQVDESSKALVLAAGKSTTNSMDLLSSDQFKELLTKLAEVNDMVILDSSPVMAVSDARVLSRMVDKTIFVIRWAETRREVAMTGLKQIVDAGGAIAGVALSIVNVKEHARYGYGDSGAYYGRYQKYYAG